MSDFIIFILYTILFKFLVYHERKHRETVLEKERIEKEALEAEDKRQEQMQERKKESHKLAQDVIKQELDDRKCI